MLDVVDSLVEQLGDVVVEEAVNDVATASVASHQSKCPQQSQLVGDRRLLHPDGSGQFAN